MSGVRLTMYSMLFPLSSVHVQVFACTQARTWFSLCVIFSLFHMLELLDVLSVPARRSIEKLLLRQHAGRQSSYR